jgi:hypothetical protein
MENKLKNKELFNETIKILYNQLALLIMLLTHGNFLYRYKNMIAKYNITNLIKIRYLLCIYLFIYLSNHIPIGVI